MSTSIRVIEAVKSVNVQGSPAHWANEQGTRFKNPWTSWREHDWRDMYYILFKHNRLTPKAPENMSTLLPTRKPTWNHEGDDAQKLKATWIGHASFFVELPARANTEGRVPKRGARILFDPIFSTHCAPIKLAGTARITPPACALEELPEVDAVVISHNHYDHLDRPTLTKLAALPRKPHFFAPLGNLAQLMSVGVPQDNCHVLDWWQSRRVEVDIPSQDGSDKTVPAVFDLTCTPNQHGEGRTPMDRMGYPKSLWASWVAREVLPDLSSTSPKTVYFAGDTGYRAVLDEQNEDEGPVCEAFKQIGEKFGPIDLALLPIGAYAPRRFMSTVHCSPKDSALVFKDIKAKRAIAMHWGAFILTTEPIMEPPKKLKEACEEVGIEEGAFICTDIGQTMLYD
ncbi:hypothetical protein D9758_005898 [Tetrapyrgos nigripes]|uniref:Metallo-beta-lactamase domain-containing protein n=1 Tax=Tetrapyrgos nigripes TaxID=182062 RepID=A0A8H5G2T1_9AGAR|nr:hypothetical protein D9758_005898 [Tetrapyrgos nigripes]